MASLVARAATRDLRAGIVTTDKDLLQVVDARTSVWNPSKEMTIDTANVKEVFGAEAGAVVDVLALWGDPTDNVPGVPGIGEKTAKALIQEFGSLDNLLGQLEQVKNPRVREKIAQNRELLELSRAVAPGLCPRGARGRARGPGTPSRPAPPLPGPASSDCPFPSSRAKPITSPSGTITSAPRPRSQRSAPWRSSAPSWKTPRSKRPARTSSTP